MIRPGLTLLPTLLGYHLPEPMRGLCRLLGDWLIWEDSNPSLTATLHLTVKTNTKRQSGS